MVAEELDNLRIRLAALLGRGLSLSMKLLRVTAAVLLAACSQSDGAAVKGAAASPPVQTVSASGAKQTSSDSVRDNAMLERADAARIQGAKDAPVWIVEISDFQCPYCKMWHDSTYPAIKKQYVDAGIVRMAYVNLPLSMHPNAVPAAEAAMCAAVQDKFWDMHDALFSQQTRWAPLATPGPTLDSIAVKVGVDASAWRACVKGGLMRRLITGDRERASMSGASSTPTFFVGSEGIKGAAPLDAFKAAIERARTKASGGDTKK